MVIAEAGNSVEFRAGEFLPISRVSMPAPIPPDESTYAGRFAARLRELRAKKKMTVDQLATAMTENGRYTPAKAIYRWENADNLPQIDTLPIIALALKIPVRQLLPEK